MWGDSPPSTANNLVSIYVHRLQEGHRRHRGQDARLPGARLPAAGRAGRSGHRRRFESLVADGRTALAAGDPERAAALLGEALGLWRGPLLADVPPSPLLATHADRAAELRLTATELRIEADLACGRAAQVIPELRGLVAEHPLRERLWALLMRALEEAGRRAEALEIYAQARQVIADELGVDPGSELQRLYADLLAADASAAPAPPAPRRVAPRPTARPARARRRPLADVVRGCRGVPRRNPARPPLRATRPAPRTLRPAEPPSGELAGAIAVGTFADPSAAAAGAGGGSRRSGSACGQALRSSPPTSRTSPAVRRT